jgi:hypothetical protein
MILKIKEGVARVGKGNVEAFLSKKELEILAKTRFAFKVVLFQKTLQYTNAINIYYSW